MKVLFDTSVWSVALRRNESERAIVGQLLELIEDGRVVMIGSVRRELLSGVRRAGQFEKLREALRAFPDEVLVTEDYETAAEISNRCLAAGVAGSAIDLLLCAVAQRRGWTVYTTDRDFRRYAGVVDLDVAGV